MPTTYKRQSGVRRSNRCDISVTAAPEPACMLLIGGGLLGMSILRRRSKA